MISTTRRWDAFTEILVAVLVIAAQVSPQQAQAAGTVSNGNILFQRGYTPAPYNIGASLIAVDPVSNTETSFGIGSQAKYSFDGTKLVFTRNAQLFFAAAGDYGGAKGLLVPGGGSPEIALYPSVSPDNTQVAYQKPSSVQVGGSPIYHTFIINTKCVGDGNQYNDPSLCNETQLNAAGTNAFIHASWHPLPDAAIPNKWKLIYVRTSANKANVDAGTYTGDIFSEEITVAANGVVNEGTKANLTNPTNNPAFVAKYSFPT